MYKNLRFYPFMRIVAIPVIALFSSALVLLLSGAAAVPTTNTSTPFNSSNAPYDVSFRNI